MQNFFEFITYFQRDLGRSLRLAAWSAVASTKEVIIEATTILICIGIGIGVIASSSSKKIYAQKIIIVAYYSSVSFRSIVVVRRSWFIINIQQINIIIILLNLLFFFSRGRSGNFLNLLEGRFSLSSSLSGFLASGLCRSFFLFDFFFSKAAVVKMERCKWEWTKKLPNLI